jgi:hypothetical protein
MAKKKRRLILAVGLTICIASIAVMFFVWSGYDRPEYFIGYISPPPSYLERLRNWLGF